ncbi:unnamed protein product [Euphydryas editha]|uniref:Uncharacterized protein n=1 Tax=Euphydryas editha TaxID=104508 RepID=A0AAU9UBQ9_EUPED|nr:unnamed protein product [Euphydryas editha]
MASEPFCVFECNSIGDKILLFTQEKLKKCREILTIRVALKLKYNDVNLPVTVTKTHGYHSKCCKDFLAVPKKYIVKYDALQSSETPSTSRSDEAGPSENISHETMDVSRTDTHADASESARAAPFESIEQNAEEAMDVSMTDQPEEKDAALTDSGKICFFCDKTRVRKNARTIPIHSSTKVKLVNDVMKNAHGLDDKAMLQKINHLPADAIIYYHNGCKTLYLKRFINKPQTFVSKWHHSRQYHELAFKEIIAFIEEEVLKQKKPVFLRFITSMFNSILEKFYLEMYASFDSAITDHRMLEKLKQHFEDDISVVLMHNKKIISPRETTAITEEIFTDLQDSADIQRAALILRKKILNITKKPLPSDIKLNDLIAGECDIPLELSSFLQSVICGPDKRTRNSSNCLRKINSISQDVIYATHHGKIKTGKHITLAMVLKSITSSRKVIDIINRFGHCCSYNVAEELETEITYSLCKKRNVCPEDTILSPKYCTGVAFDNYDRYVETCNGKDTLHDTVGILYQNIIPDESTPIFESDNSNSNNDLYLTVKRRRTLDVIAAELPAYTKKPKLREHLLPVDSELRMINSSKFEAMTKLDILWLFTHYTKIPSTPMWVGFNSKIIEDNSMKQKISYLTPINASPTDISVVYETMRQSQQIAQECQQPSIQVTYDLAIAKIAMQIQSEEKPIFQNLFIHMGDFHTMLAYFKGVGKFIDECGLTHMMVESELLASGSVNGFISGKHFNRCKRLHPIVSLGLQILHVEQFIIDCDIDLSDDVTEELLKFQSEKSLINTLDNEVISEIVLKYLQYKEDTKNGKFGKTAQYYMMYIDFINYYLMLTRSIRMGDFELYKYVIPKISNIFFIFNQINYARWLQKYYDNLLRIEETHPDLAEDFKKGMFGVKRTDKDFSRVPVDLTLEQTINAEAARKLTGVSHFTNSISARQRWAKSHGTRSEIISYIMDICGLKKAQDITAQLEKHQIKKDNLQLRAFIEVLRNNMNPFDSKKLNHDKLYNISTGRCASDSVSNFLLKAEEIGELQRKEFISKCAKDINSFEESLKKNKIFNFSSSHEKKKVYLVNKTQEVRMQRDLFGRMLGISIEKNTDIEKVLTFPITPIPMSLCHTDGSIFKTDKSSLMKCLQVESTAPTHNDFVLIDGFFLLHCIKDVPRTFEGISKKILQMLTNYSAPNVHLIFDRYYQPSIKDYERCMRGRQETDREYVISGPQQVRPPEFAKELRNDNFKTALVSFLIDHWESDSVAEFIGRKKILLNHIKCYLYEVDNNNKVVKTESNEFSCPWHEEADTKIVFHAMNINYAANITVRCSDTDILIILLGNMHHRKSQSNIWIDCGVSNKRRIIDVNKLSNFLGDDLCKALPGFHAFTGCDYNPAFFRKGKQRPFKIMSQSQKYTKAFSDLGDISCNKDEVFQVLEEICFGILQSVAEDNYNEPSALEQATAER